MVNDFGVASRARELFDAHVAANHAGDAVGAERALQALRSVAKEEASTLPIFSRALTEAHCWAGHARLWHHTELLLNELRGVAQAPAATDWILANFCEALFNAHIFGRDRPESMLLCLAELRHVADRPEATEPQRTWLCMALYNHVNCVLQTDPDSAMPFVEQLRHLTARGDTSEKQRTQLVMVLNNVGRAAAERGDLELAQRLAAELTHLQAGEGQPDGPPLASKILKALEERFADDLRTRACESFGACKLLAEDGHAADALWLSERIWGEFGTSTDVAIREAVVSTLQIRAFLQRQAGKLDQALRTYDRVLVDFHPGTTPILRHELAVALLSKGNILAKSGQTHAALTAYTALLQRFGDSSELDVRRHVATALVDRSAAFAELGQLREAFQDLLGLEQSFGADTDPITVRQFATGLANQAMVLRAIGRPDHALIVCNQLIDRFVSHEDVVIGEMVRQALQLRAEVGSGSPQ